MKHSSLSACWEHTPEFSPSPAGIVDEAFVTLEGIEKVCSRSFSYGYEHSGASSTELPQSESLRRSKSAKVMDFLDDGTSKVPELDFFIFGLRFT